MSPKQEIKIWGTTTRILNKDNISIHVLRLVKGGTCSTHYHQSKHNHFYVVSGKLRIQYFHVKDFADEWDLELGMKIILEAGESFNISPFVLHEFCALEDSVVIETTYVVHNDDDIIRVTEGFLDKTIE